MHVVRWSNSTEEVEENRKENESAGNKDNLDPVAGAFVPVWGFVCCSLNTPKKVFQSMYSTGKYLIQFLVVLHRSKLFN